MKTTSKVLVAIAASAVALVSAPAFAAGTTSGSTITNTVTVNYQVGGVAQTAQVASNNVTVDRKVIVSLVNTGATTSVSPGQTSAVTSWQVTNSSNDVIDFALGTANQATGATAAHGGTDAFDVSNFRYYVMPGNAAVYNAGTAIQVTYLDEVAADATLNVFVVADIPGTATNAQVSGIVLTGTAAAGGGSGAQGTALVATAGANTAGVDTVLADGAGFADAANDGQYSARGDYTVAAPVLTVTKLSSMISDPVNGVSANAKAIPGAVIEYCIVVANAAGAATATNVAVSDPLPATVTYNVPFGALLNGTFGGGVCTGGTAGGSFAAGTVSGTLNNLAAGQSLTFRFRATIN